MAGNTSSPEATVVERIMAIFAAFDEHHTRLSLSDVARRAELPLTTLHRLAGELVRHGALARVGDDYVISRRLWEMGLLAPFESTLREAAAPFLHDIYAATRATVHLAATARRCSTWNGWRAGPRYLS